mgnify:FL=1
MYTEYEIRQLPLTLKVYRQQAERFLADNGLRLDDVDYYAGVYGVGDDSLLAAGGLKGNVIKCIAVDSSLRDEGISNRLVSHLISVAHEQGHRSIKVFTKPENQIIFESLSFRLLARAPKAILMETGDELKRYCERLSSIATPEPMKHGESISHSTLLAPRSPKKGMIVMNANPFTRGHRYLIEQASQQVDHLFVMAVREDLSLFSYSERLAMMKAGCHNLTNVTVLEGSEYAISATTFPTYFLKQLSDASDTQMLLDLDLFARHIAPSLGVSARFVGTEPTDTLTCRYNQLMKEMLAESHIDVVEIERLKTTEAISASSICNRQHTEPISASSLRALLQKGSLCQAIRLAYPTSIPYLLAHEATWSLQSELDATPKPGLVDKHDNGSHRDMDYPLMQRSIQSLHPYFVELANAGFQASLPTHETIQAIGIRAERAMLDATHGVNTHRGVLFCIGLAIVAAAHLIHQEMKGNPSESVSPLLLQNIIKTLASSFAQPSDSHGSQVLQTNHIQGALAQAQAGYPLLFGSWLPYYQQHAQEAHATLKTLLFIMSQLDDTNIYYRAAKRSNAIDAAAIAASVKQQAGQTLDSFSPTELESMNRHFISENISPGGSADMLALTLFVNSIFN